MSTGGKKILGYDIGGTKIAVCLGTTGGKIISSKRIPNADRDPQDVMDDMAAAGKELLDAARHSAGPLAAVGIGAPGPMDIPNGTLLKSPNMKKWDKIPIVEFISGKFGVKTFLENDANAGALAEWYYGGGQGKRNLIYLTMSTGIGGGIIAEGRLIQGRDFIAGELGHIVLDPDGPACNCGLRGCYEAFCGGKAISQRILADLASQPDHPILQIAGGDNSKIGYPALIQAVRDGNGYALGLWDEICLRNAQAIGTFINTFNPEAIILGTIAMAAGDLLLNPLNKLLHRFAWPQMMKDLEISTSSLGNKIGEYAALSVAAYGLKTDD